MSRTANVVSQAENIAINDAFYGSHEPSIDKHLGDLLNWYSAMKDDKDAISYLDSYLKTSGRHDEAKRLELIPSDWTPRTAAWLVRLHSRGYTLTAQNVQSIEAGLEKAFSHIDDSVSFEDKKEYVPNVQQRIREKASDFIGEVNGMIDDGVTPEDLDTWMRRTAFPSLPVARKLIERLEPQVHELSLALSGVDDDQLVEAYRHYDNLEEVLDTRMKILENVKRFVGDVKVSKPRKKRSVNIDKVLSKFKYKKTDETFHLTSIDPRKVLGAHELWIFNTKYFTLSVLRGSGLGIKGTSITGVDPSKSYSKRIGRKTGEVLKTALSGGKVALRQLADQPLKTNRINEETILLRVL